MMRKMMGALMMAGAACTPIPADVEENVPVQGASGYTCSRERAQALVGRPASQELGAEALRLTGARSLRWIRPGDVVTMDYREDRLNIELDARSRVARLRCG